jgi:microcystin-dependent protein
MLYTNEKRVVDGTKLTKDYDLNKLNTSGWYTVTSPKNSAVQLTDAKLFVIVPNDKKYVTQFLFGNNDKLGSMWFRSGNNTDWSKWKEVATTDLYLALTGGTITGDLTVKGNIDGKFSGTPTAPDATDSSSDQQIANIKYVKDSISKLIDYSPAALDTLKELAAAIGNDPNFAATMTAKLAEKFDKVGGTVTGDITVNGNINGHLIGNAATATRADSAAVADKTQAAISFKNTDNITKTFNGFTNLDLTNGIYYSKESSHTINADEAIHAASATTVNATIPTNGTANLVYSQMADSDYFRILAGGSYDNGYVSLDTANDGTEPIYVRQFSNGFKNVMHQVTLLDGDGNSNFTGTVTAPIFNGHVTGIADNATNATHADKADNALYASVANRTGNSISFKNANNIVVSFNGSNNIDLTNGVYYATNANYASKANQANNADTAGGRTIGYGVGQIPYVDGRGKIPDSLIVPPFTRGMIMMWYGSSNNVPSGWAICNGSNGTPDLRDRFVVAAGNKYSVGSTGGEETHTLTINEMPSHTHSFSSSIDDAIGSFRTWKCDPQATGVFSETSLGEICNSKNSGGDNGWRVDLHINKVFDNVKFANNGGNQAHNNLPPYYALFYIMRL